MNALYFMNKTTEPQKDPVAEAMAAAKKQQVKSTVLGIVATLLVAGLGSLVLRFFGIDVFKYVTSYQLQQLLQSIFGN